MAEIKTFDLVNSPLEGTNLIEASAGTGKTYTIAGLVLRLILENKLAMSEILVVTFTVAATDELRHRIRQTLKTAEDAFKRGHSDDTFFDGVVKKFRNPAEKVPQLTEALRDFDEAAIFTIHGFCQKVLQTNAFETGALFDTELIPDEAVLRREIADDFWRRSFFPASPLFVNYALSTKTEAQRWIPDTVVQLMSAPWAAVETNIMPAADLVNLSRLEAEYSAAAEELCRAWPSARTDVANIIATDPHLSRSQYKPSQIPGLVRAMDEFVAAQGNAPESFPVLDKLSRSGIQNGTKKRCAPPQHPIFDCVEIVKQRKDILCQAYERQLLGLRFSALEYLRQELRRRKQDRNVQSFDDLLVEVRTVIAGELGDRLVNEIRRTYRAALIDEFQDTDPIQYSIFDRVFRQGKGVLFLIGDPKQSIYGFRSADIFTYFKATEDVESRYTLEENWRSETDLVKATNTLFSRIDTPFVYDEIPFRMVKPAAGKTGEVLKVRGKDEAPFRCWFIDQTAVGGDSLPGKKRYIAKGDAREVIGRMVAKEIARLLRLGQEGKALIGKDPLSAGDIAVLVSANREARAIQQILCAHGIPSVLYVTDNLFDAAEAREMDRLLRAVAFPHNARLLSAALTTDMLGYTGEALEAVRISEREWEHWVQKFSFLHEVWRSRGFMNMLRRLLNEEQVGNRLLSLDDGERRLTNVLHLGEVLHHAALEQELMMSGLIQWLSEQRNPASPRLEEHQLRLESDARAVKVVTIHRSKGLEFPIVFCPYTWNPSRIGTGNDPIIFHEATRERSRWVDLGSASQDDHRKLAEREALAENMRIFYVAVTRAKNRCYTVWGHFNNAGTSAMAYSLRFPGASPKQDQDLLAILENLYKGLDDNDIKESLEQLARDAGGVIAVEEISTGGGGRLSPSRKKPETLECRTFTGRIDRDWRISSFSSLTAFLDHGEEGRHHVLSDVPDYDEDVLWEDQPAEELTGIFAFPQGARAGLVVHELFEDLDFTEKRPEVIKSVAAEKLRRYGFDPGWDTTLCEMTTRVLSIPLIGNETSLNSISPTRRISELEFYYPVRQISPEGLKELFLSYGGMDVPTAFPRQLEQLDFQPARGFMKGFIDLVFQHEDVFYLLDWKSNFLGNSVEHYAQEALSDVMEEQFYVFQYHIYTLALHQYLRLRLADYRYAKNFGGVLYVFVRGVDPEKGSKFGIYCAKPAEELIEAMSKEIIGDRDL